MGQMLAAAHDDDAPMRESQEQTRASGGKKSPEVTLFCPDSELLTGGRRAQSLLLQLLNLKKGIYLNFK